MDGDGIDIVGQNQGVGGVEVGDNFATVGRSQVDAGRRCAQPLPAAAVDGDGRDHRAAKEVVGVVGAIVARHLGLYDGEVGIEPVVRIFHLKDAAGRGQPNGAVAVLGNVVRRDIGDGGAVLIDQRGAIARHVVSRIVYGAVVVQAERTAVDIADRAARRHPQPALCVKQQVLAGGCSLDGIHVYFAPGAVRFPHTKHRVDHTIDHPQVAVLVESRRGEEDVLLHASRSQRTLQGGIAQVVAFHVLQVAKFKQAAF